MHCRWYPSMPCSRSRGGGIPACLAGFQGSWGGSDLGGCFRPTPGGNLQAHTWGGVSRPRGVYSSMHWGRPPPNSYCCGWYAFYWNAFLLWLILTEPGGWPPGSATASLTLHEKFQFLKWWGILGKLGSDIPKSPLQSHVFFFGGGILGELGSLMKENFLFWGREEWGWMGRVVQHRIS